MNTYIDIHSHNKTIQKKILSIYNYPFLKDEPLPSKSYFSLGLHPWWIEELDMLSVLKVIKEQQKNDYFLAMGEIGLDYTIETSRDEQKKVFRAQVEFAKKMNIKNIILHCVRAYNDIISIVNEVSYIGNLIFHNYNGNKETTLSLLKYRSYFSFGKSLFSNNSKFINQFELINKRLFLETDDQNQLSIEEVYAQAAKIASISKECLARRIGNNFSNCFGEKISIS